LPARAISSSQQQPARAISSSGSSTAPRADCGLVEDVHSTPRLQAALDALPLDEAFDILPNVDDEAFANPPSPVGGPEEPAPEDTEEPGPDAELDYSDLDSDVDPLIPDAGLLASLSPDEEAALSTSLQVDFAAPASTHKHEMRTLDKAVDWVADGWAAVPGEKRIRKPVLPPMGPTHPEKRPREVPPSRSPAPVPHSRSPAPHRHPRTDGWSKGSKSKVGSGGSRLREDAFRLRDDGEVAMERERKRASRHGGFGGFGFVELDFHVVEEAAGGGGDGFARAINASAGGDPFESLELMQMHWRRLIRQPHRLQYNHGGFWN